MVVGSLLWLKIVVIVLFNSSCLCDIKRAGPYKATLVNVKPCVHPSRPYMKNPPMTFEINVYNKSDSVILDATFIVFKDSKNVKIKTTCYGWENGRWIPNYIINDIGCRGMLLHLFLEAMGIKYDKANCAYLKGEYHIKNFNQNAMQHILMSKMEYGKKMWRSEIYNPQLGMFFCTEFHSMIEPL